MKKILNELSRSSNVKKLLVSVNVNSIYSLPLFTQKLVFRVFFIRIYFYYNMKYCSILEQDAS